MRGLNAGARNFPRSDSTASPSRRSSGGQGPGVGVRGGVAAAGARRSPSSSPRRARGDRHRLTRAGRLLFIVADRAPVAADVLGLLHRGLERFDLAAATTTTCSGWSIRCSSRTARPAPGTRPPSLHRARGRPDGDPGACSRAYDLLRRAGLGGGSIRINRADVQRKVLELLRIGPSAGALRSCSTRLSTVRPAGDRVRIDRPWRSSPGAVDPRVIPFPRRRAASTLITALRPQSTRRSCARSGCDWPLRRPASNRTERLGPDGGEHRRARARPRGGTRRRERQRDLAADVERERPPRRRARRPVEHRLGRPVSASPARSRAATSCGDGADDGLAVHR